MYLEDPSKVNYVMLEQSRENVSAFSNERVSYIKELFKEILTNVLPIENAVGLVVFDHISIGKWVRLQNSKQNKYMKNKKSEDEETLEDKIHQLCADFKYSPTLVEFFKNYSKEYLQKIQRIRKWVRKLIYVRNRILQSLHALEHPNNDHTDFPMSKEDYCIISKVAEGAKTKGLMDPHIIWKLDKKKMDQEICEDFELSE